MRNESDKNDDGGRRRMRRKFAGILRGTFRRMASLERRMRDLRERMTAVSDESPFCKSLDVALHELDSMRRALADRTPVFGGTEGFARFPATDPIATRAAVAAGTPSAMAARLRAECEACGKRLCVLLQAARAIKDAASERIACVLLHILEKLHWLLLPIADVVVPKAFPRISSQFQLRASAF
jgi:hypothetical protein